MWPEEVEVVGANGPRELDTNDRRGGRRGGKGGGREGPRGVEGLGRRGVAATLLGARRGEAFRQVLLLLFRRAGRPAARREHAMPFVRRRGRGGRARALAGLSRAGSGVVSHGWGAGRGRPGPNGWVVTGPRRNPTPLHPPGEEAGVRWLVDLVELGPPAGRGRRKDARVCLASRGVARWRPSCPELPAGGGDALVFEGGDYRGKRRWVCGDGARGGNIGCQEGGGIPAGEPTSSPSTSG